ncbi:hypothetical protein MPSI1_000547 [Malassezia psittaci]|uniref:Uncharacterized protein n=1 Tax=Malassezia psittaci TaxID=1821823 RepID=A0AAF0JD06_9BASI|nr:hypothetical protein MPSI1_000547 [Malassezia psittaci]
MLAFGLEQQLTFLRKSLSIPSRRSYTQVTRSLSGQRSISLIHDPVKSELKYSKYIQSYLPPADRDTWPEKFREMAEALSHHDEEACWRLVEAYSARNIPLPFSLWLGACSLLAQCLSTRPKALTYSDLDTTCDQLSTLFSLHSKQNMQSAPSNLYRRYVYLLLKRVEHLDAYDNELADHRRSTQASTLHEAAQRHMQHLDTPLLGRAIYRLARLRCLSLDALVNEFVSRNDLLHDPGSAAQPFNAIIESCLLPQKDRENENLLRLGLETMRLAFQFSLPIRGAKTQMLLAKLGNERLHDLYHKTHADPINAPNVLNVDAPWDTLLHRIAQTRPKYLAERVAVALCRSGDPLVALQLLNDPSCLPYDVFAAAISALTWWARETRQGYNAAMSLAHQTLDKLCDETEMDPDQQMYGELVRGWESIFHYNKKSPKPNPLADELSALDQGRGASPAQFMDFTRRILSQLDEWPVLRHVHHMRLLAINIQLGHFYLSKRLYELARKYDPEQLPFFEAHRALPRGMLWLFRESMRRNAKLSFTVRLYHDVIASGFAFPLPDVLQFVRALLLGGMPTVAQRIVLDTCETQSSVDGKFASGVLKAFFHANLFEPGLALAEIMYDVKMEDLNLEHEAPNSRLEMYASCIFEASRTHLAKSSVACERLWTMMDDFRLALAHALASRSMDADTTFVISRAYQGALRLTIEGTKRVPNDTEVIQQMRGLLEEARDLIGTSKPLEDLYEHALQKDISNPQNYSAIEQTI